MPEKDRTFFDYLYHQVFNVKLTELPNHPEVVYYHHSIVETRNQGWPPIFC